MTTSGLDKLSWVNLPTNQSSRYWGHFAAALIIVVYICCVLVSEFRELIRIRQKYLAQIFRGKRQVGTAVLITDIPDEKLHEDVLAKEYAKFNGGPINIVINRDYSRLAGLIKKRKRLVCKMERHLTKDQLSNRWISTGQRCAGNGEFTALSIASEIKTTDIKINELKTANKGFRKISSAFLQFEDPMTAHLVQQAVVDSVPLSMIPHQVISAEDIAWSNLTLSWWQRFVRKLIIVGTVVGLAIFWVVPISMAGLLSQLVYLASKVSWVQNLSGSAAGTKWLGIIQGLIPQLLVSILMTLFPMILLILVKRQGQVTQSEIELSLQSHYFAFLYLHVFLVVSISSSITTVLLEIMNNLSSAPSILAKNIPKAGNYFYSYLLLQCITQCTLSLRELPRQVWQRLLKWTWAKTARDVWSYTATNSTIRWGLVYPVFSNLACICKCGVCAGNLDARFANLVIGIIFSAIAPLILPIGVVVFMAFWLAYSKKFIYVLEAPIDTGGILYWRALHQLFVGLYTAELSLIGLFWLRGSFGQLIILAFAMMATILTQYVIFRGYASLTMYLSVNRDANNGNNCEDAENAPIQISADTVRSNLAERRRQFLDPCLFAQPPHVWAVCNEDLRQLLWSKYQILVSKRGISLRQNKITLSTGPPDELS